MSMLRNRTTRLAALALAGGIALSACSAHPGVAYQATYTDPAGVQQSIVVRESDLDEALQQLAPLRMTRTVALQGLANLPLAQAAASEVGIEVSDEQVRSFLETANPDADFSSTALNLGRAMLLDRALGQLQPAQAAVVNEVVTSMANTYKPEVSPRYTLASRRAENVG